MEIEANKDLIRRFTEAINSSNWHALDDILTSDFKRHCQATPDVSVESLEEFKALQQSFLESFPDQRVEVDTMIAEGNKVGFVGTYSGTQMGPMGDVPATGKKGEVRMAGFCRMEAGKISGLWLEWDSCGFLSQLGL